MDEANRFSVTCQQCGLNALCIPYALTHDEMDVVDATIKRAKPLHKNDKIFEAGTSFESLYAVRSGAVKTFTVDEQGNEHVVGFYLPGELIGLDAIDANLYGNSAVALETSTLCELPYAEMSQLSGQIHNLQAHMYRLFSREIRADQELQMLLSKKTADERIGAFLLNLSERYKLRRLSATSFRLPMSRTDIANYLGLAVETVSRIFTRLQQQGILKVNGKDVQITNLTGLCSIAHCEHQGD